MPRLVGIMLPAVPLYNGYIFGFLFLSLLREHGRRCLTMFQLIWGDSSIGRALGWQPRG